MPRATAATIAALCAVACAMRVAAQCCMWCPNGAGQSDNFSAGSAGGRAIAKGRAVAATAGQGATVRQAQLDFTVPPVPTTVNGTLTSTLYSGVVAQFGPDTWSAIALLTLDTEYPSGPMWALQAQILQNGIVVAAGEKHHTPSGHSIDSEIEQPYGVLTSMSVTMDDPYSGFSIATYGGFNGGADSNAWEVGWGWSDASADCSVFPPGGSVQLTGIQAYDSNGNSLPLSFQNSNAQTPFCGLTAVVQYDSYGTQATCNFTYSA